MKSEDIFLTNAFLMFLAEHNKKIDNLGYHLPDLFLNYNYNGWKFRLKDFFITSKPIRKLKRNREKLRRALASLQEIQSRTKENINDLKKLKENSLNMTNIIRDKSEDSQMFKDQAKKVIDVNTSELENKLEFLKNFNLIIKVIFFCYNFF